MKEFDNVLEVEDAITVVLINVARFGGHQSPVIILTVILC